MKRRYAFSDLHGNYNLWKQIQNYITDEDEVYCLGDLCDRGPDGIKIMQEVFKDKRITCLAGNHEIMLLDAVSAPCLDKDDIDIMKYNGQLQTYQGFLSLSKEEQEELCNHIKNLPYVIILFNEAQTEKIYLTHAGASMELIQTITHMDDRVQKLCIWDRKHIAEPYWNELVMGGIYCVHGHTPIQTLHLYGYQPSQEDITNNNIVKYCGNHKVDIDICTPASNKIALFDLDTFEAIYFTDETKQN